MKSREMKNREVAATSVLLLSALLHSPSAYPYADTYPPNAETCGIFTYGTPATQFSTMGNYHQWTTTLVTDSDLQTSTGVDLYLYRASSMGSQKPTVIFVHGGNGDNSDPNIYRTYIYALVSRDIQVLYVRHSGDYQQIKNALEEALNTRQFFISNVDRTRLILAGHSYGGGVVVDLARWARNEKSWGSNVLGIHSSAPYYLPATIRAPQNYADRLSQVPSDSVVIFHIYADDDYNDHDLANFYYQYIPSSAKYWYTVVTSDNVLGSYDCHYKADHFLAGAAVPGGGSPYQNYEQVSYSKIGAAFAAWKFRGSAEGEAVVTNRIIGGVGAGVDTGWVSAAGVTSYFADMSSEVPQCNRYNHTPSTRNLWNYCQWPN